MLVIEVSERKKSCLLTPLLADCWLQLAPVCWVTCDQNYSEFAGFRNKNVSISLYARRPQRVNNIHALDGHVGSDSVLVGGHRLFARPQFQCGFSLSLSRPPIHFKYARLRAGGWTPFNRTTANADFQDSGYLSHLCSSLQREIDEGWGSGQQNTQDLRAYPTQAVEECTSISVRQCSATL